MREKIRITKMEEDYSSWHLIKTWQEINIVSSKLPSIRVLIKTWLHISQVVSHVRRVLEHFPSSLLLSLLMREIMEAIDTMIIDISYWNHVWGTCSAANLTLFSAHTPWSLFSKKQWSGVTFFLIVHYFQYWVEFRHIELWNLRLVLAKLVEIKFSRECITYM